MYRSRRFCWLVLVLWGCLPPFVMAQEPTTGASRLPGSIRTDLESDMWELYAPFMSFGWTDVPTGKWGDLTKGGVRTTFGLGNYIDPANSNIFITGGFCHSYLHGDKSRQVNQPGAGGFEGEVDQINMYEGFFAFGSDLSGFIPVGTVEDDYEDPLFRWAPDTMQIETRFRLGGVDADFTPTAFDPAKPQVLVSNPKSSGLIYGGDLVGTLGWTRPWGGFGLEVSGGLSRTDALTGDWTTIGQVGVGGTVTIYLDSLLYDRDNVERVRNWRQWDAQLRAPWPSVTDNEAFKTVP